MHRVIKSIDKYKIGCYFNIVTKNFPDEFIII